MKLLSLKNVGLAYTLPTGMFSRSVSWAIEDVSFDVIAGESIGIIGKNGAGKSSLLRLMAGLVNADRGTFVNHGCRCTLLSLQAGFDKLLTGRENAVLSGMLLGMKRPEVEAKMQEIVEFGELENAIDKPVYTYSSGMRARLGFSVAFKVKPDVLLLDEVLGVGDLAFREKSTAAMKSRIQSDTTVVLVSHHLQIIEELCDRAIWIEKGRIVKSGPAEHVLTRYFNSHGSHNGAQQEGGESS